jgi:hypothetical protein
MRITLMPCYAMPPPLMPLLIDDAIDIAISMPPLFRYYYFRLLRHFRYYFRFSIIAIFADAMMLIISFRFPFRAASIAFRHCHIFFITLMPRHFITPAL